MSWSDMEWVWTLTYRVKQQDNLGVKSADLFNDEKWLMRRRTLRPGMRYRGSTGEGMQKAGRRIQEDLKIISQSVTFDVFHNSRYPDQSFRHQYPHYPQIPQSSTSQPI